VTHGRAPEVYRSILFVDSGIGHRGRTALAGKQSMFDSESVPNLAIAVNRQRWGNRCSAFGSRADGSCRNN
jgi:hypothetical protein